MYSDSIGVCAPLTQRSIIAPTAKSDQPVPIKQVFMPETSTYQLIPNMKQWQDYFGKVGLRHRLENILQKEPT